MPQSHNPCIHRDTRAHHKRQIHGQKKSLRVPHLKATKAGAEGGDPGEPGSSSWDLCDNTYGLTFDQAEWDCNVDWTNGKLLVVKAHVTDWHLLVRH